MANRKRYYLPGDEQGVTPSQLKRFSRKRQVEYMRAWFFTYHEDPVHETPRDEGEYIYVWGGPYDANDVLQDEFADFISFERIQDAVQEVESDGTTEWAPTSQHPDYQAALHEHVEERPEEVQVEAALTEILERLRRGDRARFGSPEERERRQSVLDRLDDIDAAIAELRSRPAGIGHNGGPADGEYDPIPEPEPSVNEAIAAVAHLRTELAKPEPDAEAVVEETTRLVRFKKWMGDRWTKAMEKAVEGPMTVVITAPPFAAATWLAHKLFPHIDRFAEAVVRWAQTAMPWF